MKFNFFRMQLKSIAFEHIISQNLLNFFSNLFLEQLNPEEHMESETSETFSPSRHQQNT